ncbi:MAG: dihydroorotate dehydrogenase [Candidatus Cloacimonetes bacterium]|nr:dihydroorotate dehydrogenase [Candidatus Cloacimonadota bacterium]
MNERLKTRLGRLELANPVTVASGTFSYDYADYVDFNRLGAIVTKTITKEARGGNPTPRLFETEAGLLNSIGLQNPGLDKFIKEELPKYNQWKAPLLVSLSGSSIEEFCEIVARMDEEDCAGYEINVSCPNVKNEGIAFGVDPKVVFELTSKLRKHTERELIIKLSPNVTDIVSVAKAAKEGGADSLALINTLLGMAIDWKTGKSRIARGVGGYSGIAIKPVALSNVWRVAKAVDIPILAMGGISNYQDALEFFYAGASVVAVGTENFMNPLATIELIEKLDMHLESQNISLKDIIGKVKGVIL